MKNSIKNIFKSGKDKRGLKFYLLSFFIPISILLIIFFIKGVYFNGEKLAISDMQAQYMDMIVYFKHIFNGSESILYSLSKGLGGDMFSTFAYYMLSPLNFIALFFSEANIMQAIYLIIVVKFGLCGLTMFTYLNKKREDKKWYSILMSTSYALMAFTINSYFCIMWFDGIYMLPLVMMGIEKLIEKKKVLLFIVTLNLTILFNYYVGYMICIFSAIYFIYLLIIKYNLENKKEIIDHIMRFITSALLAGLAAAIVFVPSIVDILKADRVNLSPNATTIIESLNRLFIGSYSFDTFLSYNQPSIYCGMLIIVLTLLYFFNKKHTDKEKYVTGGFIALFVLSIFIPLLSYIWHGFSYPIGYNFRFTFLLCAFLISIAHQELCNIKKIDNISRNAILFLALLFGIYAFAYNDNFYSWLTVGYIVIYALVLFIKTDKKAIIISVLLLSEISINAYTSFIPSNNATTYKGFMNDICNKINFYDSYRVSGTTYYGTNELIACNKSTTSGFYSTLNNNIALFYGKIGYEGGPNFYNNNVNATPIIESLLGVKYFYSNEVLNNYKKIDTSNVKKYNSSINEYYNEPTYIYENPYALSLGYLIKGYEKNPTFKNAFELQNIILKSFSNNKKDILKEIVIGKNDESIINSKKLYFYSNENISKFKVNNKEYGNFNANSFKSIPNEFNTYDYKLSFYNEGGVKTKNYYAYYLDLEQFLTAINNLKDSQLENIVINKNKISGTILAGEDATLALSIPYEDGWKVYVDGKLVKYYQIYDMFMGVDLKGGNHEIEMIYYPRTLNISLAISLLSLGILIIFVLQNDFSNDKADKKKK